MANIRNGGNLKAFPLRSGISKNSQPHFSLLSILETVANAVRPERKQNIDIYNLRQK